MQSYTGMANLAPVISLQDESFLSDNTYDYKLSVQLGSDEISYCLFDQQKSKYVLLESFDLSHPDNTIALSDKLRPILDERPWLRRPFRSAKLMWMGSRSTLVPAPLFQDAEIEKYLELGYAINPDDQVLANRFKQIDVYNVFAIPASLVKELKQVFSGVKFYHFSTSLIEKLVLDFKYQDKEQHVFINGEKGHFELIVVQGKALKFYNTFNYSQPEEIAYYTLFVLEQLKLNPEDVKLNICGEIDFRSKEHDLLYKYIRHIAFLARNEEFNYSYVFDKIPAHRFFNLLNLQLCE